jgi:hypothetical protein
MKLFADENMARAIVVRLRVQGHDVLYASEINLDEVGTVSPLGRIVRESAMA